MNTNNPMQLTVWDSPTDQFIYTEIASNFTKIANHDHSGSGSGGNQITSTGLATNAVTTVKIADSNITTAKLENSTSPGYTNGVTSAKLANSSVITRTLANNAVTSDKVDATVLPAYQASSASLPTGTENKQFWTTVTSSNNTTGASVLNFSTFWSFRYSSTDTKWYFSGGAPLTVVNFTSQNIASTSAYTLISGTTVTLPYVGAYLLAFSAETNTGTGSSGANTINLAADTTSIIPSGTYATATTTVTGYRHLAQSRIVSVDSSSNNTYSLYSKAATITGTVPTIDNMSISVTPIYITSHV